LGVPPITGDTPDEIFDAITNWASIIPQLLEEYRVYMSPACFNLLSGCVPVVSKLILASAFYAMFPSEKAQTLIISEITNSLKLTILTGIICTVIPLISFLK
jgi:hypothetical protein